MEKHTQDTQEAIEKETGPELPVYYGAEKIPASFKEILKNIDKAVQSDLEALKGSKDFATLSGLFPDAGEWIEANKNKSMYVLLVCFTICDAADLVRSVYLREQGGKPSLFDFADDTKGESKLSDFFNHLEEKDGLLYYDYEIQAKRPEFMPYPLDKLNSNIWDFDKEPANGKFEIKILTGPSHATKKTKKKKEPLAIPALFYSIDFSTVEADFPFVKRLTEYDKRVCCAICSILDTGQWVMSLDEIYYSMGYTKRPNDTDRKKIYQSLTKMSARAHLDNRAEIAAGAKYAPIDIDFDFIFFERARGKVIINGKEIKDPVHILQYPRVMKFAKDRGQIQAVPMPAIQSEKISKTEGHLAIEDYLLQRIAEAKIKRQPAKILYTTMYKKLKIDGKTERQRMRATAAEYMNHYTKTGWILSYTAEKDGIIFEI